MSYSAVMFWGVEVALLLLATIGLLQVGGADSRVGMMFLALAIAMLAGRIVLYAFANAGNGVRRAVVARARPAPAVHAGPNTFERAVAVLAPHGWMIAGILFAVISGICLWNGLGTEEKVKYFTLMFVFGLASLFCFLVSAGKLKDFMLEWMQYKAATLLAVSLVMILFLGRSAYEEGLGLWNFEWQHIGILLCLVIAGLTTLYLLDMLGAFLKGAGTVVVKAFGFGYHPFLTLVLWGLALVMGSMLIFTGSKHEIFDTEVSGFVFDWLKWAVAIGFFLIVFAPLAFMGKKK